jgi:hypothetical protein
VGEPSPSPDESGSLLIGTTLDGRYRIDAIIGTGGMGRVFRGEHIGIGRQVAIKVLHAQMGRSKEATQRFQREALASGRLDHPNIVGVSDLGVLASGALYLVMEHLEGEGLGARLKRDGRLNWLESVEILRALLAGLRHAHDRGVVHRDIKPDNIFLARKDGEQIVKILDFGIAKLLASNVEDPTTTRAGLTVGTPAYLSPEQAVGGAITPASDLYSASVVLYEMLTGRTPYVDHDPLAMLTAHVSREPPAFTDVAPDAGIPPALEAVVRRGLAKVAGERFGSANEYVLAVDQVMRASGVEPVAVARVSGGVAIPTPPLGTPIPYAGLSGPAPAPQSRSLAQPGDPIPRRWLLVAVVVLVIAIVGAILLKLGSGADEEKAQAPAPAPAPTPMVIAVPTVDREMMLKAALHDLEGGKTCADRKAAIPQLVQLEDPRAIPALKKARYRGTGGLLGIGESNANACLAKDAEAAIKALGGK